MTDGATDLHDNWIHLGLGASAETQPPFTGRKFAQPSAPANM